MKLLGKKIKKDSEPCDACESISPCKSDSRLFKISAVLGEKMFNKEVNKWIFVSPENGEIVVTDNPNIEYIATGSLYRYFDNWRTGIIMYSGRPFVKVTVEEICDEKV